MKKYFKFLISTILVAFIVFETVTLGLLSFPKGRFYQSYQSVIQDKYRILKETNDPKIIMVAGSSSAFGLNQAMLEEASGYKVANLGLHAGFGHLFYSELAKANINKGDIVLLGYEYGWQGGFDTLDQNLIMSGIDDDIEMYTRIPVKKWPQFIGYLFKFAETKQSYAGASGIYSREAFDSQTGQMTMQRDEVMQWNAETYGVVDITDTTISDNAIKYLKKYKKYVEDRGASIYFVAPPVIADALVGDVENLNRIKEQEEQEIGIPYISNPTEYVFPATLMSNANFHCNSQGEITRTQLLIEDLKRAAVIK